MLTLIRVIIIGFLLYVAFAIGCGGTDTSAWPHDDRTTLGWLLIIEMVIVSILTVIKHEEII
jgi:hypothetical protein